jgi:hypothetical protein
MYCKSKRGLCRISRFEHVDDNYQICISKSIYPIVKIYPVNHHGIIGDLTEKMEHLFIDNLSSFFDLHST